MPSFDLSIDDLLDFDEGDNLGKSGEAILRAQQRDTGGKPFKTTASASGIGTQISTVNLGTLLMGAPLYNDGETALKRQEYIANGLVTGGLAESKDEDLGNVKMVIPEDVKHLAEIRRQEKGLEGGGGTGTVGGAGGGVPINQIVDRCLKQDKDQYHMGAVSTGDDPSVFDCSSLINWACSKFGISIPRTSGDIYLHCKDAGLEVNTDLAVKTRGALLFHFKNPSPPVKGKRSGEAHVAMSLGDGRTIEARGQKYGVGIFSATQGRAFNVAALIPGANYGSAPNAADLPQGAIQVPQPGGSGAGSGGVAPPANATTWTVTKYEGADHDGGTCTPGNKALIAYYKKVTGLGDLGCYNYRPIRGGGKLSLHSEGRASDLACNANDPAQKAKGDAFAQWIIDHVHQIGCQYFIWNRRSWRWDRGWKEYTGVSPHTDHLHVELTRAAAANPSPLFG